MASERLPMLTLLPTVIIPIAAIALPAVVAICSGASARRREREHIETSLRTEMARVRALLSARLVWLEKEGSRDLPLVPFETSLYDAQVDKIGVCEPAFAAVAVSFYGIVHFVNAFQATREAYARAGAEASYFTTYANALRRALRRYQDLPGHDV